MTEVAVCGFWRKKTGARGDGVAGHRHRGNSGNSRKPNGPGMDVTKPAPGGAGDGLHQERVRKEAGRRQPSAGALAAARACTRASSESAAGTIFGKAEATRRSAPSAATPSARRMAEVIFSG